MAYRTRVLRVISTTSSTLRHRGLRLPPTSANQHPAVRLGVILPAVTVESASARPLLPLPAPHFDALSPHASLASLDADTAHGGEQASQSPGGSPSGTVAVAAGGAAARPARKGPLAFLPGGRLKEELVSLSVHVRGRSLNQCRHVGIQAFGEAFTPVELSSAPLGLAAEGGSDVEASGICAPASPWAQLSALQHAVRRRVQHAAAAASRAARGVPPPWRPPRGAMGDLTLRVLLPRSVVARLAATMGPTPSADGGGTAAAAAPLVLQLKSDCQVVSVPVRLEPYVVGVAGSSQPAAALAAALVSGEVPLPQPAVAAAAPAAAAAASRWPVLQWRARTPAWLLGRDRADKVGAAVSSGTAAAQAADAAAPAAAVASAKRVQEATSVVLPLTQSQKQQLLQPLTAQQQQEQRKRRRMSVDASSVRGPEWVEPWVPQPLGITAGTGPVAQKMQPGSADRQAARKVPARRLAVTIPFLPTQRSFGVGGAAAQKEPQRMPALAKSDSSMSGSSGVGGGGNYPSSPSRAARGLRANRPASSQLLTSGGKAATAAPVAGGVAGAGRRRRSGSDGGSSRLPAVAATVEDIQLASDDDIDAAAGSGGPYPWVFAGGLLRRAQSFWPLAPPAGLQAPWVRRGASATTAAAAAPAEAKHPASPQSAAQPPVRSVDAVGAGSDGACSMSSPVQFVLLPHPFSSEAAAAVASAPSTALSRAAQAAGTAASRLVDSQRHRRLLRGVDVMLVVADVEFVLQEGGTAVEAMVRSAADAGLPLVVLLVQSTPSAPPQLAEQAELQLRQLLGNFPAAIVTLNLGSVASGRSYNSSGCGGSNGDSSSVAAWATAALGKLSNERRAELAAQVAAARAALHFAIQRGAEGSAKWALPAFQRSKL